jgi:hypothetical protein
MNPKSLPLAPVLLTLFVAALAVLRLVMSLPTNSGNGVALLLPDRSHIADYYRVRDHLSSHGFTCGERVHLGTSRLMVGSRDFKLAHSLVTKHIGQHALTLLLAQDPAAKTWEVWERGTKQREESYVITASSH